MGFCLSLRNFHSWLKKDIKIKEQHFSAIFDSSKVLDFQVVFIINADSMPFPLEDDKEREVSLFYIGMTRAKEYLCFSYSGESEFTQYLDRILLERNQTKGDRLEINK